MRLFVAVHVGPLALRRAEEVRQMVEQRDPELARHGMKWVSPAQMHLTLRFLGEVRSPLAEAVLAALDGDLQAGPFPLGFGSPAWLPPRGRPRVLMLPVARGAERLEALKGAVESRLPPGVPPEDERSFSPHLTVARIRDEWQRRAQALGDALVELPPVPEGGVVGAAVLVESHLGPRGPVYHERARLSLAAPPG